VVRRFGDSIDYAPVDPENVSQTAAKDWPYMSMIRSFVASTHSLFAFRWPEWSGVLMSFVNRPKRPSSTYPVRNPGENSSEKALWSFGRKLQSVELPLGDTRTSTNANTKWINE